MDGVAGVLYGGAGEEVPSVEVIYLPYQFRGVRGSVARGLERMVLLCLVATQHQQVLYAQKLQVEEHILQVLAGVTAAYDMRHHGYAIPLLYGRGYGNGARPASDALALHQPSTHIVVDILATMSGDVDVSRLVCPQAVYGVEQLRGAVALQGREHLEGERTAGRVVYEVDYLHAGECVSSVLCLP